MSLISCPPPEILSQDKVKAAVQQQEPPLLTKVGAGFARLQEPLPCCVSLHGELLCLASQGGFTVVFPSLLSLT